MKMILVIAALCCIGAPAWTKEKDWTALFVYGDGRVMANETLKNEQTCREAICAVKYRQSCADEAKAEEARKIAAEKAAEEYKKKVAIYRVDHPCVPATKPYGDDKQLYLRCPLPGGGEEIRDAKGTVIGISNGSYSGLVTSGTYDPRYELKYSACFQQSTTDWPIDLPIGPAH